MAKQKAAELERFPGVDPALWPKDAEWVPVKLDGPGDDDPVYLLPKPLPQTLHLNGANWDLSDRAAGIYIPRHR